ncbi:ADP-ribosylation factor-like protein 11 isoform X2 [Lynx rufus]|uniref:ADP-ribosylation factor-like protein 11 isoform X2 n=1 Tax=Lynx rufus TaxID=61384 RepID=UPI001F12667B|nr:ADP-ribosylation factor-like protein 11 isoform X2 [Lynx rufus]
MGLVLDFALSRAEELGTSLWRVPSRTARGVQGGLREGLMSLPRPRPPGKGSGKGEPATVTAFPSHLTLGTQQDEDRAAAAGCGQTATEEELFQPQSSNRDLPSRVSQDFWVPWSISATKCCCSNGQKKPFSSFLCTTGSSVRGRQMIVADHRVHGIIVRIQ